MASVQTTAYGGRYLKLTVVEESTSILNNTSTLRWTLESIGGSSNYYSIYKWGVWIGNTEVYPLQQSTEWNTYSFPAAKGTRTGTITVNHKDDGTADDITFTLKGCVYYSRDNSYSDTISLSKIARVSEPTLSASTINVGEQITITTNRKADSLTHKIYYSIGNINEVCLSSNVGTSYSWTIPKTIANKITASDNATMVFKVVTVYNNEDIGSKEVSLKVTVPDTAEFRPSISQVKLDELGNVPSSFGFFVQNISKIKGTISAGGAYGSTISSYAININNEAFTSSSFTTAIITLVNPTIKVVVTDTRGRKATYEATVQVLEYNVPTIDSFVSYRNSSNSKKLDLVFSCSIYKLNSKNTKQFVFYYKKNTDSSYTSIQVDASKLTSREVGNVIIYSANYSIATIEENASYNSYLVATDVFKSIPSTDSFINTIFKLLNISATKREFAIGKLHEKTGYIENALPEIFYENIYRQDGDYNGLVLSCPSIVDGKITFNSTNNTLELSIGSNTYAISLQRKN